MKQENSKVQVYTCKGGTEEWFLRTCNTVHMLLHKLTYQVHTTLSLSPVVELVVVSAMERLDMSPARESRGGTTLLPPSD